MSDANANISVSIDTSAALAQLKELQRQISLFHNNVTRSTSAAALAQRDLQKSLIDDINATGKFAASLTRIKTSAESFTDSLERNKFSMREYFRYAAASTKTFGKAFNSEFETISRVAEERVKTLQTQYIKLGRDANGALQSIAVRPLTLDLKDHGTQLSLTAQKQALFNQLMKQGSTNLLNFGKNTQWAGRQLMVGFTIPLTLLGSTASKVFMDMEAQAIKFKKVYGDLFTPQAETQEALDNVKELGRMFTRYGVAITDTMGIAAEAAAAGFQGTDLMRQTREATRLSVLGEIDRQQALKTTMALQNAFGLSSDQLAEKINFLNAVENQTVTSLDDITQAIPRVAPVIRQLGGDVEDLAYFLTAMKEGGINAAEGANALKSGLASIINPTGKAAAMFDKLNINVQGIVTKNKGNLKATIQEFALALDDLDPLNRAQALEQLFGKFQLARVSALFANIATSGSQASKVLGIAGTSIEDLAATAESELGLIEESASTKFKAAVESLKVSIAPVGEEFLKAVTPIVEFFGNIADKFNNLSDRSKRIITIIVGLVGAIGPVFLMTFGLLANGIANIIKLFMTLRGGFQRITGQSNILTEQTQYLTQAQAQAAAVAHSLDQTHANLIQTFNVEAGALENLARVYERADRAGMSFAARNPLSMSPGFTQARKYAKGVVSVPGPKGAGDVVPAMLSPGESVIPAKQTQKYGALIQGIVADNIPGYQNSNVETRISSALSNEDLISSVLSRTPGISQRAIREFLVKELRVVPEALSQSLKEIIAEVANSERISLQKLKNELKVIRSQYNKNIGQQERAQFAHAGLGSRSVRADVLARSNNGITDKQVIENLNALAEVDPTVMLRKRGGLGYDLLGKLNNEMQKTGAQVTEFLSDFTQRGPEKWKKSIEIGGGNFEKLLPQIKQYDDEITARVLEFQKTNKIITDRDFDLIEKQTRANLGTFGAGLKNVLDIAENKLTEIRFDLTAEQYAKVSADPRTAHLVPEGRRSGRLKSGSSAAGRTAVGLGLVDPSGPSAPVSQGRRTAERNVDDIVAATARQAGVQSPSKRTIPIGEDIARGLEVGMANRQDDVARAGENLGLTATTGVSTGTRRGRRGVTTAGRNITPGSNVGLVATGAPAIAPIAAPLIVRTSTEERLAESQLENKKAIEGSTRVVKESTNSYIQHNGKLMGVSMAMSSLAGIGTMFGGKIGDLSQKVFALSSAMFALQMVTQLVTKEKFLEVAARRASIASEAMSSAAAGGGLLAARGGIKGLFPLLGRLALGFVKFLGPIGWITTAATLGFVAFNKYRDAQEKSRVELEKLSIVARTSKEEIAAYGEIFGFTPTKLPSQRANAAMLRQDKRSEVDRLRNNDEFIKQNKQTIDILKNGGLSQGDALTALTSKGLMLRAAGASEAQVQTILTAIAEESGRKDLVLNFKNTRFTEQAIDGLDASITNLAKLTNNKFNAFYEQQELKRQKAISDVQKGFEKTNLNQQTKKILSDRALADINRQYNAIKPPKEVVAGLRDFSNIFSQNAQSIAGLLEQGIIDIKQYDASWKSLSTTFANLEPKAQALASSFILKDILNETNPELYKMTQRLEGIADQALMVQLATFGMTQELMSYISVASNLKTAQEGTREGGLGVLAKAEMAFAGATKLSKKQIREKAKAMATLAKEYKKYIDLQNQEEEFNLKEVLEKQIGEIEKQAEAFKKLAKAKVDANIISNIMGNPEAAAVLAKAEGAVLTGYIKQLQDLFTISEKLKNLQDVYKPEDEILKDQLESAKNLIDFQQFQYDLQFDKELKLGELQSSRNDYALAQISKQEKLIEDSYNKQFESLDELTRKQEQFNQLQQGKFSLAQALSQGDMAGAASAIQNIRDQEAKAQLERRRQLLEQRKEEELAAVKIGGKTRSELEKENDLIALRRQRIELQKQEFAAQQTALNMTKDEIDNAIEALDLAKNAKVNVNSKTFLKNVMGAIKGDASALLTSVDEAGVALDIYINKINESRRGIEQTVIDVANLAKNAQKAINSISSTRDQISSTRLEDAVDYSLRPILQETVVPRVAQDLLEYSLDPSTQFIPYKPLILPNNTRLEDAVEYSLGKSSGGKITGPGTSTSDSIPALLSNGEYVIRASSVNKYGVDLFEKLNAGKFATGGGAWKESVGIGKLGNFINKGMGSFYNSKPVQTVGQIAKSLTIDPLVDLLQSTGRVLDPRKAFEQDTRPFTERLSQAATDAFNVGSLGAGAKIDSIRSSIDMLGKKELRNIASYVKDPKDFVEGSSLEKQLEKTLNRFNVAPSTGPLYRGTKSDLSYLQVGDVYKRPRRTSTTTDITQAGKFTGDKSDIGSGTVLKILPNENTKGLSIQQLALKFGGYGIGKHFDEAEMLLGSGNFKVVDKKLKALKNYVPEDSFTNILKPRAKILEITLEQIKRSRLEEFIANVKNKRSFNSYKDEFAYLNEDFSSGPSSIYNNIKYRLQNMMSRSKNFGELANGGLIKKFAMGGYASGKDTIPAMLSQGEYVIKKKAVDTLGLDTMNTINQGQIPAGNTNSVYNYNLSVNVSNSNASPNDIARTVINQIRQIEGQRIRGNR